MKKIISVLLVIMLTAMCAVPAFAEEQEEYDIIVSIPEVIVYDESVNGVPDSFDNLLEVSVTFKEIERFKSISVKLDVNKELIKYETSVEQPERACIYGCSPTQTGVVFSARLGESAAPDVSYSRNATGFLAVLGTGEHNMKISVDARDKNDNPVDVKVKFKQPYEKIVDVSEVSFVNTEKFETKYQNIMLNPGTKVDDIVNTEENRSAVVTDSNGELLKNDASIPTGAFLTTMYNGFVVDKVQIFVMEDVNCDAKITAADARLALRTSAKLETLYGVCRYAADVNNDDKITSADARLILRKSAGL